jgi:hypothetical protein
MSGPLLHLGATVLCAHGGQAAPSVAATRVFAAGQPVLLMSSQAICAPTGTPLVAVAAQTRVIGM